MTKGKKFLAGVMSAAMLVGMVAAPMAAFAAETNKLTVAVISDIQYQAGATDSDGLILSKSGAMLDEAVAKINAQNPDVVMVTGDLTNDGSQDSHDYVAGKLAQMEDADTQVYVVPGEKDIAKSGVNAGAIDDTAFKATYKDLGYDDAENILDETTLSYVAYPKDGYELLMLDSVGTPIAGKSDSAGRGEINKTWAEAQVAEGVSYGDMMIGAAHHPSVSRGSVEATLIGLVYTLENLLDANGSKLYDGPEQVDLINMVDKSAFSYADMQALCDAGMKYIYTGHSYMVNTVTGAGVTSTEGWTDYNVGSLVAGSASVTYTTYDNTAATPETKAVTTVDALGGATLRSEVMAAQEAYTPAMVNNMVNRFAEIYPNLITILKNVAPKFVDGIDFGAGISGDITGAIARPAVKNLINDVLAQVDTWAKIEPAVNEIKTALMATNVATEADVLKTISYILSDVAVQLQEDHNQVAPSLRPLVNGLKADPADVTIASNAVKDFADKLVGTETLKLINNVLNQKLSFTLGGSHTIREMLNGPVKFFAGLATVDLWAILDGIQPYMPDGVTPVPPEAKPSAVAKPLVQALLLKNGGTQDVAGFKAAIATGTVDLLQADGTYKTTAVSDALVNLTLRFGIANVI